MQKKKLLTILLSIMLTLTVAAIAIAYLSAPDYIPYSDDTITVTEKDDGTVFARLGDGVSGYRVSKHRADDNLSFVYHMSVWDSMWNRYIAKNNIPDIVLNPDGEKVSSVYYNLSDGNEDILIYGVDQNPDGGMITLPRLFLSYYVVFALIFAVICGFVLFVFRKNEKAKNIMINILLLPVAYLFAHICIKGFTSASYSATRDFFAILWVTAPLYIAVLIMAKLLVHKKSAQIK